MRQQSLKITVDFWFHMVFDPFVYTLSQVPVSTLTHTACPQYIKDESR